MTRIPTPRTIPAPTPTSPNPADAPRTRPICISTTTTISTNIDDNHEISNNNREANAARAPTRFRGGSCFNFRNLPREFTLFSTYLICPNRILYVAKTSRFPELLGNDLPLGEYSGVKSRRCLRKVSRVLILLARNLPDEESLDLITSTGAILRRVKSGTGAKLLNVNLGFPGQLIELVMN